MCRHDLRGGTFVFCGRRCALLHDDAQADQGLHGEVSDPLPQEFAFLNDVDDLDESFNLNDPQGSLLLSKAGIKPGIYDLELKAHESFVGNLNSIRNTDHTDIIGKNPNAEENDTRAAMNLFLNKQGISGRATAQSYFMYYCAGEKGLSIQETLNLTLLHLDQQLNMIS